MATNQFGRTGSRHRANIPFAALQLNPHEVYKMFTGLYNMG
jgi:hypothetical protein